MSFEAELPVIDSDTDTVCAYFDEKYLLFWNEDREFQKSSQIKLHVYLSLSVCEPRKIWNDAENYQGFLFHWIIEKLKLYYQIIFSIWNTKFLLFSPQKSHI